MKKRIQIIAMLALVAMLITIINLRRTMIVTANTALPEPSAAASQEPEEANHDVIKMPQVEAEPITLPAVSPYTEPEQVTLTDMDDYAANYDLIRGVILAEARGEGIAGMHAVAQVIYDRVYYYPEEFGNDLYSVLTSPGQFAKPYYCEPSHVTEAAEEAMEAVFVENYRIWDFPVTHFYNPATASESGSAYIKTKQYVATLGNHEFRTEWGVDLSAYNQ